MPSIADLLKKQIEQQTAQAQRKAEKKVTTPDQILTDLISDFESRDLQIPNGDQKHNSSKFQAETSNKLRTASANKPTINNPEKSDYKTTEEKQPPTLPINTNSLLENETIAGNEGTSKSKQASSQTETKTVTSNRNNRITQTVADTVTPTEEILDLNRNITKDDTVTSNRNNRITQTVADTVTGPAPLNTLKSNTGSIHNTQTVADTVTPTEEILDLNRNITKDDTVTSNRNNRITQTVADTVTGPAPLNTLKSNTGSIRNNRNVRTVTETVTDIVTELPSFGKISIKGTPCRLIRLVFEYSYKSATRTSGPLNYESIAKTIYSTSESVRITTYRLIARNFISLKSKNGSSGYVEITLHPELYNFLATNFIAAKSTQTVADTVTDTVNSSSSSISSYINTTNTREPVTNVPSYVEQVLPNEWKPFSETNFEGIDIEPLSEIGFTETHLKQLYTRGSCSKEILQESIYRFAFDLSENNKRASIKLTPLNFFMGIMQKSREYAKPENYKSAREIQAERRVLELQEENKRIEALESQEAQLVFTRTFKTTEEQKKKITEVVKQKFPLMNPEGTTAKQIAINYWYKNEYRK